MRESPPYFEGENLMKQRKKRVSALTALTFGVLTVAMAGLIIANASESEHIIRAALDDDAIQHIIVIDLENESFADTFGPSSPATYLNNTLLKQGELIQNYYATSHVSLGNYIAQISGQAPTPTTNSDCLDLSTLVPPFTNLTGGFMNVSPGSDAADSTAFPGQVVGDGCVYPAATASSHGARTIADQLDAIKRPNRKTNVASWRLYAEDM